jgi:PIN domain
VRVRLRPGASVDEAIRQLEALSVNVYSEATFGGDRNNPTAVRDTYVHWANRTEQELRGILDRSQALEVFENPRHRDVCVMVPGSQLISMVHAEIDAKAGEFRAMASALVEARDRMRGSSGFPAIIDTNVLLEFLLPNQIKWHEVVGEPTRLMLPLRVIEEVDAKKYDPKGRLRQVARDLIPWLENLFPGSTSGPVPLEDPDASTIEILLADRPRHRPSDADEEILDVYQEVRLLAGRAKLVTADGGMRLRARAEQVDVVAMPDKYLRSPVKG